MEVIKMKKVYPIVLTPDNGGYTVYIPDFDANTQGEDLTEAIEMARDAIGIMGIDMQDENEELPQPSAFDSVAKETADDVITLVDVDFSEYRRKNEMKVVKKIVLSRVGYAMRQKEQILTFRKRYNPHLNESLTLQTDNFLFSTRSGTKML